VTTSIERSAGVGTTDGREGSAIGHAGRVVIGRSLADRLKYMLRCFLLFVANRLIGAMPGHKLRLFFYRHLLGWKIGDRSSVHHGLKIFGGRGRVSIGDRSTLQMDCLIVGAGMDDLVIGNDVAVAYRSQLIMGSHDILSRSFDGITGPITIEDHVFIGTGVTVLLGVTIGEGAVITAGSVVTKSIPPYSIARGNPAQVVGRRPKDLDYSAEHFWPFH